MDPSIGVLGFALAAGGGGGGRGGEGHSMEVFDSDLDTGKEEDGVPGGEVLSDVGHDGVLSADGIIPGDAAGKPGASRNVVVVDDELKHGKEGEMDVGFQSPYDVSGYNSVHPVSCEKTPEKADPKDEIPRKRYSGVSWHKDCRQWIAQVQNLGSHIHLGSFHEEEMAARSRDLYMLKINGTSIADNLNFPIDNYLEDLSAIEALSEAELTQLVKAGIAPRHAGVNDRTRPHWLIGKRIVVWWEAEGHWYAGRVMEYAPEHMESTPTPTLGPSAVKAPEAPVQRPFRVEYEDGDSIWHNWHEEKFKLLPGSKREAMREYRQTHEGILMVKHPTPRPVQQKRRGSGRGASTPKKTKPAEGIRQEETPGRRLMPGPPPIARRGRGRMRGRARGRRGGGMRQGASDADGGAADDAWPAEQDAGLPKESEQSDDNAIWEELCRFCIENISSEELTDFLVDMSLGAVSMVSGRKIAIHPQVIDVILSVSLCLCLCVCVRARARRTPRLPFVNTFNGYATPRPSNTALES